MLLHIILPAILVTTAQAAPTLHGRQNTIYSEDTLLAPTEIEGVETTQEVYDGENYGSYTKPLEIAMNDAPTKPPQGFEYTNIGEYDGYCLSGYTDCRMCQKEVGCFPAKRVSGTEEGRTVWQLCESDVKTSPCADYDNNKVFTQQQFDDAQH